MLVLLQVQVIAYAVKPFKFAFITDLHIATSSVTAIEDIKNTVDEINAQNDIAFVIIGGDITHAADSFSMALAKKILQQLKVPYYLTAGNHDVAWNTFSNSAFLSVFQQRHFSFTYNGVKFISIISAPSEKYALGHFAPQDIDWLATELKLAKKSPLFFITHYPLLPGDVDNGMHIEQLLAKTRVQAVISGHYHRNVCLNYNGINGLVLRSNLRANASAGGYTIIAVSDSITISEKRLNAPARQWLTFPLTNKLPNFPINN